MSNFEYAQRWKQYDHEYNKVYDAIDLTNSNDKYAHKTCKGKFLKESYLTSQKALQTSCEIPQQNELGTETQNQTVVNPRRSNRKSKIICHSPYIVFKPTPLPPTTHTHTHIHTHTHPPLIWLIHSSKLHSYLYNIHFIYLFVNIWCSNRFQLLCSRNSFILRSHDSGNIFKTFLLKFIWNIVTKCMIRLTTVRFLFCFYELSTSSTRRKKNNESKQKARTKN